MDETLTLQFDGGSRGNPGPAGIGVVLRAADGTPVLTLGRFIGRATNNVAEYTAVITGLEEARKLGARKVAVRGDSELIIKQLKGEYRVKHPDMRTLYDRAVALIAAFDHVEVGHNYREKNELADKLANLAMDRRADVTDASGGERGGAVAGSSSLDAPAPSEQRVGERHACPRCGCAIEVRAATRIRPHQVKPFVCVCGAKMGPPN